MRIAILISGEIRFNEIHLPVVVSSGDDEIHYYISSYTHTLGKLDRVRCIESYRTTSFLDFPWKGVCFEPFESLPFVLPPYPCKGLYIGYHTTYRALCMWASVYKSLSFVKNLEYDWVVRWRPDVKTDDPIQFPLSTPENNDVVYVPRWHGNYPEDNITMMDQCFYGSGQAMNKMMSVYLVVTAHWDDIDWMSFPPNGEGLMKYTIDYHHLSLTRWDVKVSLRRASGWVMFDYVKVT